MYLRLKGVAVVSELNLHNLKHNLGRINSGFNAITSDENALHQEKFDKNKHRSSNMVTSNMYPNNFVNQKQTPYSQKAQKQNTNVLSRSQPLGQDEIDIQFNQ